VKNINFICTLADIEHLGKGSSQKTVRISINVNVLHSNKISDVAYDSHSAVTLQNIFKGAWSNGWHTRVCIPIVFRCGPATDGKYCLLITIEAFKIAMKIIWRSNFADSLPRP
jgi:hypothetical protein